MPTIFASFDTDTYNIGPEAICTTLWKAIKMGEYHFYSPRIESYKISNIPDNNEVIAVWETDEGDFPIWDPIKICVNTEELNAFKNDYPELNIHKQVFILNKYYG